MGEHLFETTLMFEGRPLKFDVVFHDEKYHFQSTGEEPAQLRFTFARVHDEWKEEGKVPDNLQSQAVDALEKYLLRQH